MKLRLVEVRENGNVIAAYGYDNSGNRASLSYPNGVETSYVYNDANLVTRLENRRGQNILSAWDYTYRSDGNQLTKTDENGDVTAYEYDRLGRLTKETEPNGNAMAYTFDDHGNRATMTVTGTDPCGTVYTYDLNNRLLTEVKTAGQVVTTNTYGYDQNGNQTARRTETLAPRGQNPKNYLGFNPELDFVEILRYNGFNRPVLSHRKGVTTRYAYRPDGLRDHKSVDGVVTKHLWDGGNICAEFTSNGNIKARYLRGANLISQEIGSNSFYYLFNAHGDTIQQIDQNGDATPKYKFDAFGVQENPNDNDPNPFRYCGEYWDRETKSYYLRSRSYNPESGRFSSEDTVSCLAKIMPNEQLIIDPLSLNRYTYCGNNPITYCDPSGHMGERAMTWGSTMFWLLIFDGVAPFGDAIYLIGLGACAIADAVNAIGVDNIVRLIAEAPDAISRGIDSLQQRFSGGSSTGGPQLDPEKFKIFSDYAKQFTHNANSNTVALGKWINGSASSYERIADKFGYTYYQMDIETWNRLSAEYGDDMWNINQQFLQQQIDMGKNFFLTHNPFEATGFFAQEIDYLIKAGYQIVQDGAFWRAVIK